MQVVHFEDPKLGSVRWELPEEFAAAVDEATANQRKATLRMLEAQVKSFITSLMVAAAAGKDAEAILRIIVDAHKDANAKIAVLKRTKSQ